MTEIKINPPHYVGPRGVLLNFYEITRGFEEDLLSRLEEKFQKAKKTGYENGTIIPCDIFWALGRYDVIEVLVADRLFDHQSARINQEFKTHKDTKGILDTNHIFCFSLEEESKLLTPQDIHNVTLKEKYPFCLFSFFTINPYFLEKFGFDFEKALHHYFYEIRPNIEPTSIRYLIFHSLSSYQVVLMSFAEQFDALFYNLAQIRQMTGNKVLEHVMTDLNSDDDKPIFIRSHSIPAIRNDFIKNDSLKMLSEQYADPQRKLRLRMDCTHPEYVSVSKYLTNKFNKLVEDIRIYKTTGTYNLSIDLPADIYVKDYSDVLLEIGKANRDKESPLYGKIRNLRTEVLGVAPLSGENQEIPPDKLIESNQPGIKIDENEPVFFDIFAEKKNWSTNNEPSFLSRQRLLSLGIELSNLAFDPVQWNQVNDLLETAKNISNKKPQEYIDNYEQFGEEFILEIINEFEFALSQRKIHAHPDIFDATDRCFANRGGIQRTIQAANGLIKKIFLRSGQSGTTWEGFTIFGYETDYACNKFLKTIHLPYHCIFEVDKWWGVFHELGHLIVDQLNYPHLIYRNGAEYTNKSDRMVTETFCDLYAIYNGFSHDYSLYLKSTWKYLIRRVGWGVFKEHPKYFEDLLYRSLLIWLCFQENSNGKDLDYYLKDIVTIYNKIIGILRPNFDDKNWKEHIEHLVDDIRNKLINKLNDRKDKLKNLKLTCLQCIYLKNKINIPIDIDKSNLLSIYNNLADGKLVDVNERPELIPLSILKYKDQATTREKYQESLFRIHLTAFLSLWNWQVKIIQKTA